MDTHARKGITGKYGKAETIGDIFEVVKDCVRETLDKERAGLMLGLADLGTGGNWIGAYWMVGSNAIIMNSIPLKRIGETSPRLYKPYMFHILLHEYLHSIGVLDEERTRALTYSISQEVFGEGHVATRMAGDISKFLPNITYPGLEWKPDREPDVVLIEGFDRMATDYIG